MIRAEEIELNSNKFIIEPTRDVVYEVGWFKYLAKLRELGAVGTHVKRMEKWKLTGDANKDWMETRVDRYWVHWVIYDRKNTWVPLDQIHVPCHPLSSKARSRQWYTLGYPNDEWIPGCYLDKIPIPEDRAERVLHPNRYIHSLS